MLGARTRYRQRETGQSASGRERRKAYLAIAMPRIPTKEFAAQMRDRPTPGERRMGTILTQLVIPFEPQRILGNYVVDFYIPEAKLVIEVDGMSHYTREARQRDNRRTKNLMRMRAVCKVIRFTNLDVQYRPGEVAKAVLAEIPEQPARAREPKPAPSIGHPDGRKVRVLASKALKTAYPNPIIVEHRRGGTNET